MLTTGEQLRAARAILQWEQATLAERSGVSLATIKRLEKTAGTLGGTKVGTLRSLEDAFKAAGIRFSEGNGEMGIHFPDPERDAHE